MAINLPQDSFSSDASYFMYHVTVMHHLKEVRLRRVEVMGALSVSKSQTETTWCTASLRSTVSSHTLEIYPSKHSQLGFSSVSALFTHWNTPDRIAWHRHLSQAFPSPPVVLLWIIQLYQDEDSPSLCLWYTSYDRLIRFYSALSQKLPSFPPGHPPGIDADEQRFHPLKSHLPAVVVIKPFPALIGVPLIIASQPRCDTTCDTNGCKLFLELHLKSSLSKLHVW